MHNVDHTPCEQSYTWSKAIHGMCFQALFLPWFIFQLYEHVYLTLGTCAFHVQYITCTAKFQIREGLLWRQGLFECLIASLSLPLQTWRHFPSLLMPWHCCISSKVYLQPWHESRRNQWKEEKMSRYLSILVPWFMVGRTTQFSSWNTISTSLSLPFSSYSLLCYHNVIFPKL